MSPVLNVVEDEILVSRSRAPRDAPELLSPPALGVLRSQPPAGSLEPRLLHTVGGGVLQSPDPELHIDSDLMAVLARLAEKHRSQHLADPSGSPAPSAFANSRE